MQLHLIHTKNFTAKGIHFFMKLYCKLNKLPVPEIIYNHALIFDEDTGLVYEADFPKVIALSLTDWKKIKKNKTAVIKIIDLKTNKLQRRKMLDYLEKQIGKKYEVINFLWHIVKVFTNKWFGNKTDKKHYCCELAIRAINQIRSNKIYEFLNPYELYIFSINEGVNCKINK